MKEANHAGRYIPNIILTLHPLVQSRIRILRRAAPSQTEVTDLNCSDHSTTSKEMIAWRALGSHPSDTDSGSDSTIHYGVNAILQPTNNNNNNNDNNNNKQ